MPSWSLKAFAVGASTILVLTVFSQLVGTASSPGDGGGDAFAEQARRLTIAPGASRDPRVAFSPSGALHLAWIDARDGADGVYAKASRDGGSTFGADAPIAAGLRDARDLTLATSRQGSLVGAAWSARPNASAPAQVYVRASSDDGRSWGTTGIVGQGYAPSFAAAPDTLFLAYVHGNASSGQVRLVALNVSGGSIRGGRALLGFNASALDVALVVAGGRAHVVWAESFEGGSVIAHVSVTLATKQASSAHVVATVRGSLGGRLALVGRGATLALVWSDDSLGTFDVLASRSEDAGETWTFGPAVDTGPSEARAPAIALGDHGLVAIAWRDDRTGTPQVFGRLAALGGAFRTAARRISDSPAGVDAPAVAFGAGRDLVLAWTDLRDGNAEVYADVDVLLDRPRSRTMRTYVRRLAPEDFAPPARQSRALLLGLLDNASERVERQEEENAIAFLRDDVMPRFDGYRGGDPRDDLVVNATAQADLMNLAERLVLFLRGSGGTRLGDGEPDPPPPGDPGDPGPQPLPDDGDESDAGPSFADVAVSSVTHSNAVVTWNVTTPPGIPVSSVWIDWGRDSVSEHRTWDNASPYQVTLTPLEANTTFKIRAGAHWLSGTYSSDTFSFFSGVVLSKTYVRNITAGAATVEWTTNLPATSTVRYGANESNLVSTATGANGTFHQVNLTGLASGTTYWFRAKSVAAADAFLWKESGAESFLAGLRIDHLARAATQDGAYDVTFTWTTGFEGTSEVRYGTTQALASEANGTSGTNHSVVLSGLASNTTYYWQVFSQVVGSADYACVSTANTWDRSEESICGSGDAGVDMSPIRTPPIGIMNVMFTRGSTWILTAWNTTYEGDAIAMWWTGTGPKSVQTVSESALTHEVNITNLTQGTTYWVQLNSTSSSNGADIARTTPRTVTTRSISISAVSAVVGTIIAWVNWTTDANATSAVDYGTAFCRDRVTGANGTSHSVTLTGLLPDTAYYYCVRSAALANLNDTVVDSQDATGGKRWFRTLLAPNDANSSTDAGGTFGAALPVEPDVWKGWVWVNQPPFPPPYYNDAMDFYQFQAFAGAQIRATLTVPISHDLDLYAYRPTGALACQSVNRGQGAPEAVTCDVGTYAGYWRLEVRRYNGIGRGDYTLSFKVVGGGPEQFVVDVGAAGDTGYATRTPGLSVGTAGWTSSRVSSYPSTAVDAYRTNPYPNYREVTENGTFYLNLYRTTADRYNDYLFTVQYYGTQETNVSVWNGAGWVTIATVYGQANWRASSFTLEHTLFYDAEPTWAGMNVKLRFEKPVQVDLIAAVPAKHTTYVGNGSDDDKDEYHMPGIRTFDGWVNQGMGYKNATASGATILVTPADLSAGYMVRLRFDGNSSGFTVQRCTGTCGPVVGWVYATSASNFTAGEALFTLDPAWYVDAFPEKPGVNVWLRLVPRDRLNETTQFTLTPVHWGTDVGVAGDNVTTNHLPGMSVYPNAEWSGPQQVEGRSVRLGAADANLYVNLPWPYGSMIAYITYNATANGVVQMWDGTTWTSVGPVLAGGWRSDVLFVQGMCFTCGGQGGPSFRMFHDEYGDAFVNVLLRFTVAVTLDAMWVDVDGDGDNLTSYGEPNPYAYEDATTHLLRFGEILNVDWFAPVEGRWQFDLSVSLQGWRDDEGTHFSALEASVDGVFGWSGKVGYRPQPWVGSGSYPRMLCPGNRRLRIASTGDADATVTRIAFRKVPTNPDSADTDGDGLRDGQEACAKRTDPTVADTDGDGLTDYEEVYAFSYNNATTSYANVTVNVTVDAMGEYQWRIRTSGTQVTGPLEAVVYLDGQLKWSKTTYTSWSNLEVTFDANLPKGLHSLQVQKATANGYVTLSLVNVTKPRYTNALYWDTDRDGLSDGDELLGKTGWMLSPTKWDTDNDSAGDGDEVRALHTDPLLPDTDHDGYADGVDLDPLYDLVLQVRITSFQISADTRTDLDYQAYPGVNGAWTRSASGHGLGYFPVNHVLSRNVPDVGSAAVKVQVFNNDQPVQEIDVSTQTGQTAYTRTVSMADADAYVTTCGDVSSPRRGCVTLWIRVVRVGKANTVLMVPNDWSTLSNGTVDGTPTGLHRYVGEQRFIFALLNVTDGAGDLVSYDLEAREGTYYQDASGNGLHACHVGDSAVDRAMFGRAVALSGDGSYLQVCGQDPHAALNGIDGSMTIAFWIRPGTDYSGGTGWAWSFGREGLWRIGYSAGTLRFEARDGANNLYAVSATTSLRGGLWVHVAATLAASSMCLYVDGELLADCATGPGSVRDGDTDLYLGRDAVAGTSFKGALDEFRLYKTALSADGVRGLLWFTKGSNSVLIPRGVFYDSLLFAKMTNASSDLMTGPLKEASIHANDNNDSAHMNSRVIQMVIEKNITLEDAYGVLVLLWTNRTENVTAFAMRATNEFYTLGFAWEVSKLVANATVENGGNYTESPPAPPPPNWWDAIWNTIVGALTFLFNALIAVLVFFAAAVVWLANVAIGLTIGLVTGNWTYFEENVVEPFLEALEALVNFIIALVQATISVVGAVIGAIIGAIVLPIGSALFSAVQTTYAAWLDGSDPTKLSQLRSVLTVVGTVASVVSIIILVFEVAYYLSLPFTVLVPTLLVMIMGFIIQLVVGGFGIGGTGSFTPASGGADYLYDTVMGFAGGSRREGGPDTPTKFLESSNRGSLNNCPQINEFEYAIAVFSIFVDAILIPAALYGGFSWGWAGKDIVVSFVLVGLASALLIASVLADDANKGFKVIVAGIGVLFDLAGVIMSGAKLASSGFDSSASHALVALLLLLSMLFGLIGVVFGSAEIGALLAGYC